MTEVRGSVLCAVVMLSWRALKSTSMSGAYSTKSASMFIHESCIHVGRSFKPLAFIISKRGNYSTSSCDSMQTLSLADIIL